MIQGKKKKLTAIGFYKEEDDGNMDEIINQKNQEFIYNIKVANDDKIKLFTSEGGLFMQKNYNEAIYLVGFVSTQYIF